MGGSVKFLVISISALALLALSALIHPEFSIADEVAPSLQSCESGPPLKGKSRQRLDSLALMTVAGALESQGEADFHLKYAPPARECLVKSFALPAGTVVATYNPFEKGESTLSYRFKIDRQTDDTEILVLYSGLAGLVAGGGFVFYVAEERGGVISWYALFREEPAYPVIKELIGEIVNATTPPLMAVRWPTGSKEGEIVAYDSKRLK